MHICAEIMYDGENGSVHSDICLSTAREAYVEGIVTPKEFYVSDEYRKFLHANLDEWLDKSNGTGLFYIGDITGWALND